LDLESSDWVVYRANGVHGLARSESIQPNIRAHKGEVIAARPPKFDSGFREERRLILEFSVGRHFCRQMTLRATALPVAWQLPVAWHDET